MKLIIALLAIVATAPTYAVTYKCINKGKITYQEFPCKGEGGEFTYRKDISPERQKAAQERLQTELTEKTEASASEAPGGQSPNTIILPGARPAPERRGVDMMIYNSPGTLN